MPAQGAKLSPAWLASPLVVSSSWLKPVSAFEHNILVALGGRKLFFQTVRPDGRDPGDFLDVAEAKQCTGVIADEVTGRRLDETPEVFASTLDDDLSADGIAFAKP